jgi:hypothetical protein
MREKRKDTRRRDRRVSKPLPVLVFWRGKSGRYTAYIDDVGMGGCFLNTAGRAEVGEQVIVEIPEPTGDQNVIAFPGAVIPQTRKLTGFGLRFSPLSEEQRSLLAVFMRQSPDVGDRRRV